MTIHTRRGAVDALIARLAPARGRAPRARRREGRGIRGPGAAPRPRPRPPPGPRRRTPPRSRPEPRLDISGFAMLDMGYQSGQNHPDWYDVVRPTKLPAFENEYGEDGRFYAGVRQSRLGVQGFAPTDVGEIKTIFEFELFGTGVDAGQTTFRLRHAWGELGQIGAGQTWSPFMDPDVFPNSVEYWGPTGHGVLPQRAAALDALAGRRLALRGRARAAGRVRRPGRLRRPHRARGRPGPLPAARPLRAVTGTRGAGATSRSPASCAR